MTTAIAYTSGKPHIGNTYEVVLADSIARFKRAQGYDVFFQTGTDEHGQKIELKAEEAGITCKEFVDQTAGEIRQIWDMMNTSYDKFIRTTDEDHENKYRKYLRNCTIKVTFIKDIMKECTVLPVSHFLRNPSWQMENVPIAEEKCSLQRKRHISSK